MILLTALFFIISYSLSSSAENVQPTGPYETLRDYIAALEARGKILKIKEVDQDKYEGTAFVYRMLDEKGLDTSPGLMFEKVKIDGDVAGEPHVCKSLLWLGHCCHGVRRRGYNRQPGRYVPGGH